jgi:hypothetical protein
MTLNQTQLAWTYNNATGLLSAQTGALTQGFYIANVTASDIAGNTAVEAWNFTVGTPTAPMVAITSPTTANPVYTQSGKPVPVTFTYTEPNPLNWTITISNAAHTVPSVSNSTAITPGTQTATVNVTIDPTAPGGNYNVAVTMYNINSLSNTTTQTNAVVVDNTLPIVTITSPVSGENVTSPIWINGTVTAIDMGTNQPTINDTRFTLTQWVSTTGAFSFSNNTDIPIGSLAVNVTFTDLAGNVGTQTVTFTANIVPEFAAVTALLVLLAFTAIATVLVKKRKTIKT